MGGIDYIYLYIFIIQIVDQMPIKFDRVIFHGGKLHTDAWLLLVMIVKLNFD